jgi:hypothetical protein
MRAFISFYQLGKMGFNDGPGMGAIGCIPELNTNSGPSVALCTRRGYPYDFAGNRQALFKLHYGQQQEYFVSQRIALGALNKQAATLNKRHIRTVKRLPILD